MHAWRWERDRHAMRGRYGRGMGEWVRYEARYEGGMREVWARYEARCEGGVREAALGGALTGSVPCDARLTKRS